MTLAQKPILPFSLKVMKRTGPVWPAIDVWSASSCTVLIMAANRRASANPLAAAFQVTHKCALPVAGIPMIERVVGSVRTWAKVRRMLVSIESPEVLQGIPATRSLLAAGELEAVRSGTTLAQSVLNAAALLAEEDFPLVITTGDNVLHTAEIMDAFFGAAMASNAAAVFALTPRKVVSQAYPAEAPGIGYLEFAEGEHSNCNIYLIRNKSALRAANVMQHGGQFRSHPWRILRTVGLWTLARYKLGRLPLQALCIRLEKIFKLSVGIVFLPWADAPIDADTPEALVLIERILNSREASRRVA
jgi:GTP:adenosylcobinamide-phosphate guanylyltransferase